MRFFCQNFRQYREQGRFVYMDTETGGGAEDESDAIDFGGELPEGMELNLDDLETIDSSVDRADEAVRAEQEEGRSFVGRAWNKVTSLFGGDEEETSEAPEAVEEEEVLSTHKLDAATEAYENEDLKISAKVFKEVKGMTRKEAEANYGLYRNQPTGKDMAYAVLDDMGLTVQDKVRASKGKDTHDNIQPGSTTFERVAGAVVGATDSAVASVAETLDQGFQTDEFFKVRKAFKGGNLRIAAKIFKEVRKMTREQVHAKYGPQLSVSTGKPLAYTVLDGMGVNVQDRVRASRGKATIGNIPLDISDQEVAEVRNMFLPRDTVVNRIYAAAHGKEVHELTDADLAGTAILNGIEAVIRGIAGLPNTVAALFKMGQESIEKEFSLMEMGAKGDLILRIIDEKFSVAEKAAIFIQFLTEGVVGTIVSGGAAGLIAKLRKVQGIGRLLNKLDNAESILSKGALAAAKVGQKATKGLTGRAAGMATTASREEEETGRRPA